MKHQRGGNVHIGRKLAQCFVKVIHLGQDTDHSDNHEDVGGWMGELVVARKGQLQRNAECLDSHDRYRPDRRAYAEVDEGIPSPVSRGDLVYHYDRKDADGQ